ncbi:MAG TPA: dipeptidase PepE [Thermoanaerobaculia bacterium]|jgi:dipeptidase E|nr:dipeptidase PepE [Thermoanaerobaculia bacterium]
MRLLLISSSNVHGYGYLDHPEAEMRAFLGAGRRVAFVPFASHDHAAYTAKIRERLGRMDLDVIPIDDLRAADAIFVGGGNTFRLLKTLYERELLSPIRDRVRAGLPYLGSSAGTVIASPTMRTTNDMPIVEPPSFDALGLINFQINPHYLDPDPQSTHKGETREERIREFLEENDVPVVGLREGSILRVDGGTTALLGSKTARIFRRGQEPFEAEPGVLSQSPAHLRLSARPLS